MLPNEITEKLTEASNIPSEFRKNLEKRGYKFLGAGVDQSAYLSPNGKNVFKIFGTGGESLSRDQKMFLKWVKFCQQNSDNEFLPKFGRVRQFVIDGNIYYAMFQELLYKKWHITEMVVLIDAVIAYPDYYPSSTKKAKQYERDLAAKGIDVEKLKSTLQKLQSIGKTSDYVNDIHEENIMVRDDGTPVIIDPWSVKSTSV